MRTVQSRPYQFVIKSRFSLTVFACCLLSVVKQYLIFLCIYLLLVIFFLGVDRRSSYGGIDLILNSDGQPKLPILMQFPQPPKDNNFFTSFHLLQFQFFKAMQRWLCCVVESFED